MYEIPFSESSKCHSSVETIYVWFSFLVFSSSIILICRKVFFARQLSITCTTTEKKIWVEWIFCVVGLYCISVRTKIRKKDIDGYNKPGLQFICLFKVNCHSNLNYCNIRLWLIHLRQHIFLGFSQKRLKIPITIFHRWIYNIKYNNLTSQKLIYFCYIVIRTYYSVYWFVVHLCACLRLCHTPNRNTSHEMKQKSPLMSS